MENIVRQGEIACYKQFLVFPQCFLQLAYISLVEQKTVLCGNVLTLSQTSPGFYVSAEQVFENTVGKGEIARNEQFSFSHSVFYWFE